MSTIQSRIEAALASLQEAKDEVAASEAQLERVISELQVAPPAAQPGISEVVEQALGLLRDARAKVVIAEEVLAKRQEAVDE